MIQRAQTPSPRAGTSRVGVVHPRGDRLHVLIAQKRNGREARDGPRRGLTVLAARTFPRAEAEHPAALLREHKPDRVLGVVPGERTLCRAVWVPEGEPGAMLSALELMGEAQLPESLPAHRRAGGAVPGEAPIGSRAALLTGWPVKGSHPPLLPGKLHVSGWIAEPAAAAFLRAGGGVAAFADRDAGSISLIAGAAGRMAARVLMEENASPAAWRESAVSAIEETCGSLGLDAPEVPASIGASTLILDAASERTLREAAAGVPADPAWLNEFGIALGAAMAAVASDDASRSLLAMAEQEPRRRQPVVATGLAWLSVKRNAYRTLAAAAVLLLAGPLVFTLASAGILNAKVAAIEVDPDQERQFKRRAALYDQLEQSHWPMTKLIADVSRLAPIGVEVEDLRLGVDQGLTVIGRAESLELANRFVAALNATDVFSAARADRTESADGSGVQFTVSAGVSNPHSTIRQAEDYAEATLAERLYGQGASNTRWVAAEAGQTRSGRTTTQRTERETAAAPERPEAPAAAEVPEPLTDEQINAMDRMAATRAWATRTSFVRANPDLDPADRLRLESEVQRLRQRMDSLRGGGS